MFIGFVTVDGTVCRTASCVQQIPKDGILKVIRPRGQIAPCAYCGKCIGG